jgi:acyl-CoA thioester hydrolase
MTGPVVQPGVFAHTFTIPAASMDGNGHVNNLEYLRWMQEIAMAHSDAQGWDLARYGEAGSSWVVRSHAIEYLRPAFAGEAITVLTWIEGFEQQESLRHYLFWRERDRKLLAKARTLWVYVDAATGRATTIPAEFKASFDVVSDEKEVLRVLRGQGIQSTQ